jgi:thiol-disulfide isomerase/thioredoxin
MFYAKWCSHCKHIKPVFEEAGEQSDSHFVLIDCEEAPDICKRNKVRSYPTFKYKLGDQFYDYNGERTLDGFLEFASKQEQGTPAVEIDLQTWKEEQKQHGVSFTLYYNKKDKDQREIFEEIAREWQFTSLKFFILPNDASTYVKSTGYDL